MSNPRRRAIVAGLVVAIVAGLIVALAGVGRPVENAPTSRAVWALAAAQACSRMQERLASRGGWDYWRPLTVNRPLARVALLEHEWLVIKEDGLREIRSRVLSPTRGQAQALALYEEMLGKMRDAIRVAQRGDTRGYGDAEVQTALAIQATRTAFAREGAASICNFPI